MAYMSEDKKPAAAGKIPPMPAKAPAQGPIGRPPERPKEIGGPKGPEPTRYGDWESNGRCSDF
jgi:hypothetical protein